jgi:hypothetical protein
MDLARLWHGLAVSGLDVGEGRGPCSSLNSASNALSASRGSSPGVVLHPTNSAAESCSCQMYPSAVVTGATQPVTAVLRKSLTQAVPGGFAVCCLADIQDLGPGDPRRRKLLDAHCRIALLAPTSQAATRLHPHSVSNRCPRSGGNFNEAIRRVAYGKRERQRRKELEREESSTERPRDA